MTVHGAGWNTPMEQSPRSRSDSGYWSPSSKVPLTLIGASFGFVRLGPSVAVKVPLMRVVVALVTTTVPALVPPAPPQMRCGVPADETCSVRVTPLPSAYVPTPVYPDTIMLTVYDVFAPARVSVPAVGGLTDDMVAALKLLPAMVPVILLPAPSGTTNVAGPDTGRSNSPAEITRPAPDPVCGAALKLKVPAMRVAETAVIVTVPAAPLSGVSHVDGAVTTVPIPPTTLPLTPSGYVPGAPM